VGVSLKIAKAPENKAREWNKIIAGCWLMGMGKIKIYTTIMNG
jgi:hypothetical protein